jgi:hypothetical protein
MQIDEINSFITINLEKNVIDIFVISQHPIIELIYRLVGVK